MHDGSSTEMKNRDRQNRSNDDLKTVNAVSFAAAMFMQ